MIEGICPNCGKKYYGWALLEGNHACGFCGSLLRIGRIQTSGKARLKEWLGAEHSLDEMNPSKN